MKDCHVIDANVLIDFYTAEILPSIFHLPFNLITPDAVVYELDEPDEGTLLGLGLVVKELSGQEVREVSRLAAKYPKPSRPDLFALVLAKRMNVCLLTGDKNLKIAAEREGVKVKGTLWLMDELVQSRQMKPFEGANALRRMLNRGRRLPLQECERRIKAWT